MSVFRLPENPIIKPSDIKPLRKDFEITGVFNAGVTRYKEEVVLLLRVAERPIGQHPNERAIAIYDVARKEVVKKIFSKDDLTIDFSDPRMTITPTEKYLTSLSHLRVARSKDGVNFIIEDDYALFPSNKYETFGLEDPRISLIEGVYYINYVTVSPLGVTTCLASTKDFQSFERHGVIFCPDNKDVILFPEKIDGKYYALHRPVTPLFEKYEIWLAESPDLRCWGNHRYLMGTRKGCFDSVKLGGSAVPFKIDKGWLEVYHGVDESNRYCLGAVLLDAKEPWKVLGRSKSAILTPETDYELEGFYGNVVFTCGLLCEEGKLKIYYGVADTSIAYAEIDLDDVVKDLNFEVD